MKSEAKEKQGGCQSKNGERDSNKESDVMTSLNDLPSDRKASFYAVFEPHKSHVPEYWEIAFKWQDQAPIFHLF